MLPEQCNLCFWHKYNEDKKYWFCDKLAGDFSRNEDGRWCTNFKEMQIEG